MVPSFRPRLDEKLSRRDQLILVIVGAVVLLLCVAAAIGTAYQSAADRSAGCVNVNIATYTGGLNQRYCGAQAQRWCAAMYVSHDATAADARSACAAAGYGPRR